MKLESCVRTCSPPLRFVSQGTEARTVIPSTAVLRLQDRDWVFVKLNDKQFRRTEVQAGPVESRQNATGAERTAQSVIRLFPMR